MTGTAATNAWATATASWPVIASTTSSVSTGWTAALTAAISAISASSTRQAAGGVEDDDVADLALGGLHAAAHDVDDGGPDGRAVDRDVEALAERLELVGGGRAVRVGGDEEGPAAELDDVAGELGGRGRLAGALQADHRDDGRVARQVEGPVAGRQQRDQLVVDDLDDLLAGRQALEDLVADRPLADARDEVLDDLEVDVRLEERETDLAHGGIDVGFADPAAAGQACRGSCAAGR